jgi:RNA-directed DNA polymerase
MKRHGFLFRQVVSFENLLLAAQKALKGKKHKAPGAAFYFDLEKEILALQEELTSKEYIPRPLTFFFISEPKRRKIGKADFRDRVVHHAVCNILEPLVEKSYIYHSYACRKGKGTHRALRQAQLFCRQYKYFLKGDIKKYFASIHHQVLKEMLARKFKDPEFLWLLHIIIDNSGLGQTGIPIGNLTSQHFANFYLDHLDHFIKDILVVKGYIRYMDDFLLFADSKSQLHLLKARVEDFLSRTLRLELKENAVRLAHCITGIPFLGFRIFPGILRLRNENKRRWLKKLRKQKQKFEAGIIDEITYSRGLNSMFEHLKIADTYRFRRNLVDII